MIKNIKSSNYIAYSSNKKYLDEVKKSKNIQNVKLMGFDISVFPKVYKTSKDTELMAKTVKMDKKETFLEIGTGCGAVAIYLAKKAKDGVAVDINPNAVRTGKYNAGKFSIKNVKFIRSDLFSKVKGKFDVILFNPPYLGYKARDLTDRMFWDPKNKSKIGFFKEAKNYLKQNGRIYFGWSNFKDLDTNLPIRLAEKQGFVITRHRKWLNKNKGYSFIVFEMRTKE